MSDAPMPLEPSVFGPEEFREATGAGAAEMADLGRFLELLREGTERMNLVGPSALESFWPRHAFDSAQLLKVVPDARRCADLGAGAGFPGLVLAILLKSAPGAEIHLVESLTKRCRFLSEVVETLGLPAVVHNRRAEDMTKAPRVEIVTARACAPLERLLGYAKPFFGAGAKGVFLKGGRIEDEIEEARKRWRFDVALTPSLSDPSGRIVHIERLARA